MLEPGAFPVSRRAGAPGGLGFVQTGFVGLLREKIAPVLGCERSTLVAGSLARLAAGMPLRAAFREFAAGKAESGLLGCPKAPPAGCASLQPRGRTGELRQCPAAAAGLLLLWNREPQRSPLRGARSALGLSSCCNQTLRTSEKTGAQQFSTEIKDTCFENEEDPNFLNGAANTPI